MLPNISQNINRYIFVSEYDLNAMCNPPCFQNDAENVVQVNNFLGLLIDKQNYLVYWIYSVKLNASRFPDFSVSFAAMSVLSTHIINTCSKSCSYEWHFSYMTCTLIMGGYVLKRNIWKECIGLENFFGSYVSVITMV